MSSTLHTERIVLSQPKQQTAATTANNSEPISDDEDLLPLPNTKDLEETDRKACFQAMDLSVPVNKAIDTVQKAIDREPDEPGGYICLGKIAINKSNNHLAAVQQFTTAYELSAKKKSSQQQGSVSEGSAETMVFMSLQARAAARMGAGDLNGALKDATAALKAATSKQDEEAIQDIRKHIVQAQLKLRRAKTTAAAKQAEQPEYKYGSTVIQEIVEEEDPQEIAATAVDKVIAVGEYTANRAFFKGAELREQSEKELSKITLENEERKRRNAERASLRTVAIAAAAANLKEKKKKGEKKESEVVIERTKIPIVDATAGTAAEEDSQFKEQVAGAMKQRQWSSVLDLCNKQLQANNKDAYALYLSAKAEYQLQNYRGCVDNCEAALIALRDDGSTITTTATATTTAFTPFDILMLAARGWKVLEDPDRAIAYLEPAQEAAETDEKRRKAAAQLAEALRMKDQLNARQKAAAAALEKQKAALEQDKQNNNKKTAGPLVEELPSEPTTTTTTDVPAPTTTTTTAAEAPPSPNLPPSPPHTTTTTTATTTEEDETFDTKGADEERERGNTLFKQGHYVEALDAYESACVLNPVDPKAFANAAAVLLKLEQWDDCIAQCEACLALDDTYAKAYRRRAEAYKQIGSLAAAYLDLMVVMKIDVGDRGAVKELLKVKEMMVKQGIAIPDV